MYVSNIFTTLKKCKFMFLGVNIFITKQNVNVYFQIHYIYNSKRCECMFLTIYTFLILYKM